MRASGCCKELVEVNLCGLEEAVWLHNICILWRLYLNTWGLYYMYMG